jgi:hypothetical protein
MNPGIFLIQDSDELVEMNEQPYDSENLLQTLLARYPALLAGSQIDAKSPRKWLLIDREFGVPLEEGGSDQFALDHLFLDQDAIPTIVEVKRSTDTRIRREVVGQMLDYAANAVVYWPVDRIRSRFEANCERQGSDPDERLRDFLDSDVEPEEFWQKANVNLQAGRIRLLFIADQIPTKLQRIVEFLNEQMNPAEVLAVEIKQFVGQGLRSLVPRVIGQTAEAQQKKNPGPRPKLGEDEFFQILEENTSRETANLARKILVWSKENFSHIRWREISFAPVLEYDSYSHIPISVSINGNTRINFGRMKKRIPAFRTDEKRLELLRRLNDIRGIDLPPGSITRNPKFPLTAQTKDDTVEQFLKAIAWTIEEIKAAQS